MSAPELRNAAAQRRRLARTASGTPVPGRT